jgi:hypothetical protein
MAIQKTNNTVVAAALRTIYEQQQNAKKISTSTLTGLRNTQDLSSGNLITGAALNSAERAGQGRYSAMRNMGEYAGLAQDSMTEVEVALQEALSLAASATDPTTQVSTIALLDSQYSRVMAQITNTVATTHDAAGNKILSGVIGNYNAAATGNIALILGDPTTIEAVDAPTANTQLQAIVALHLDNPTKARLNAAANISTGIGGVAGTIDYLSRAMAIIPNIGVDPSQINAQLTDAIRSAKLATLICGANGAIAASIGAAQAAGLSTLVANLVNGTAGTDGGVAAAPVGANALVAAQVAAFLTPSEKANLLALVNANAGAGGVAVLNQISGVEFMSVFSLIQCFSNVTGFISNVASATQLQGANIPITAAGTTFPAGAKGTISQYILNAATSRIASAVPQTVQIGLSSTDTLSIQINDMSQAALGLSSTDILNTADAQTAITQIQAALQYVANAKSMLNGQIAQLSARRDATAAYIDDVTDQYNAITKSDLIKNATDTAQIGNTIAAAASAIGMEQSIQRTIFQAAKDIIRAAAASA